MSFEMKKYMGGYDPEEHVEFYACCIMQNLGDAVFAFVAELEEGVYLMRDPLRVVNHIGKGMFELSEFCHFSDDTFYIIKDDNIETISFLSEKYVNIYKKALQDIDNQTESDVFEEDDDLSIDEIEPIGSIH